MSEIVVNRCPYCCGLAEVEFDGEYYEVRCMICGRGSCPNKDLRTAVFLWNIDFVCSDEVLEELKYEKTQFL